MLFDALIQHLKNAIQSELPGQKAQYKMVVKERLRPSLEDIEKLPAKKAAVLVLIYPKDNQPHLVLMQRHPYPGVHGNQISFPGGKWEPDDCHWTHTALREAQEELAIIPEQVNILGHLTKLYIPPSNFVVQPVLAYSDFCPEFIAEQSEVAQILEFPLKSFLQPYSIQESMVESQGASRKVPAYVIDGRVIWGASAMILAELTSLIE